MAYITHPLLTTKFKTSKWKYTKKTQNKTTKQTKHAKTQDHKTYPETKPKSSGLSTLIKAAHMWELMTIRHWFVLISSPVPSYPQLTTTAEWFLWHHHHHHHRWVCTISVHSSRVARPLPWSHLPHSELAPSTLKLWYYRSFFIAASQEVWGHPAGLLQSLWGTLVRILWDQLTDPFLPIGQTASDAYSRGRENIPDYQPVYSGKQIVRGDFLIFSSNRSFLFRNSMMDVSVNHLLLHVELNKRRLSCIRFCTATRQNVTTYSTQQAMLKTLSQLATSISKQELIITQEQRSGDNKSLTSCCDSLLKIQLFNGTTWIMTDIFTGWFGH